MSTAPLRELLEETFRFDRADLDANRNRRLSARQDARLRAASTGARLSLAVFGAVLLGSAGLVAWSAVPEGFDPVWALAGVAGVFAIGWLVSRSSLAALRRREVSVAEGNAEPEGEAGLRLGGVTLQLASEEQRDAFAPGAAYRIFYLAGPRALVLSAEALDERPETGPAPAEADPARDAVVSVARRARWIVAAIGLLAFQIPIVGIAMRDLPVELRLAVFAALVFEGVGFVAFALWWLGRR